MILDRDSWTQQVQNLLCLYEGLSLTLESNDQFVIAGVILVNCSAKEFCLYKNYEIKIVIHVDTDEFPYVYDVRNSVEKGYHHRYEDGRLCLETDTSIKIRFIDGFSLESWMTEFVEPYFFSYEFYKRYGEFPFGERSHDIDGIIETYEDRFNENDCLITFRLLESIAFQDYRGHRLCACNSGKRLRNCHGPITRKYYTDKRLNAIVRDDYETIMEVVKAINDKQRNSMPAK